MKNIDNKMVLLSNYKAEKVYVVVFTCNTYPVPQAYQDRIYDLNATYAAKDYPVVAFNPNDAEAVLNESFEKMQALAKEKNFSFPYLLYPNHLVTKQFGATKTPHVFVLSRTDKGNVVEYIVAIDNDLEIENATKVEYVKSAVNEHQSVRSL